MESAQQNSICLPFLVLLVVPRSYLVFHLPSPIPASLLSASHPHLSPHSAEDPAASHLHHVTLGLDSVEAHSIPPPTMCAPWGSLAWHSHGDTHLAQACTPGSWQGVAGMRGGGQLWRWLPIRPGLLLTPGRGWKGWQMGTTHVVLPPLIFEALSPALSPAPSPLSASTFFCLSVSESPWPLSGLFSLVTFPISPYVPACMLLPCLSRSHSLALYTPCLCEHLFGQSCCFSLPSSYPGSF